MCVLISPSALDTSRFDNVLNGTSNDLYAFLKDNFAGKLLPLKNRINPRDKTLLFKTDVPEDNTLACFIQINHL